MMRYLKTKAVEMDRIGEVTLVELSALGSSKVMKYHEQGDEFGAAAATIKYGTKEFWDVEVDDIMAMMPIGLVQDVAQAVMEFSGLGVEEGEGNSEGSPAVDSSSA